MTFIYLFLLQFLPLRAWWKKDKACKFKLPSFEVGKFQFVLPSWFWDLSFERHQLEAKKNDGFTRFQFFGMQVAQLASNHLVGRFGDKKPSSNSSKSEWENWKLGKERVLLVCLTRYRKSDGWDLRLSPIYLGKQPFFDVNSHQL